MGRNADISIIMGIYNCERTLKEAINSIMNQTYEDWFFIMCDDGSSDNTYKIACEYQDKYPERFLVIKNEHNMGLNYTLNHCLQYVEGNYIARMDGDDISLPERFRIQHDFLECHPEYALVSSPMYFFDESGIWGENQLIAEPQIRDFVFHAPFHCHAATMFRTEAMLAVGGYTVDRRLLRYEDCNLWYKLYAADYRGYNLDRPLYMMRDDRDAFTRRTPISRLRAVYVQWSGFKMVKMKRRYYPFLLVEFLKSILIIIMPEKMYMYLHHRKQNG